MKYTSLLCLFIIVLTQNTFAKEFTVSIRQFGAKGDGKTNDQEAFEKASNYINEKKQDVTLIIPYGQYIIGKQTPAPEWFLKGSTGLQIEKCKNITVKGEMKNGKYPKIKYRDGLYFGSFFTDGDKKYQPKNTPARNYYNTKTCAYIGTCIYISECENTQISNLEIDGNQDGMIIGGMFGDTGHQLGHRGIYIISSQNTKINNIYVHHLGLDGVGITGPCKTILITNLESTYNGRQGLSWVEGTYLTVKNSKFSHGGLSKIASSPCAGIDIEAENGTEVRYGQFENCEFINNTGYGLIADSGPSRDMTFTNCTFWGITKWSVVIQKPNYVFNKCNFYGSFVLGYITTSIPDATKFYNCNFEDKSYKGKKPYGSYLIEIDARKMMVFENCTFTANEKKVIWYNGTSTTDDSKAIFKNCTINMKNNSLPAGSFWGVMRKMKIQNLKINYYAPKDKKYYLSAADNIVEGMEMKYLIK